MTFITVHHHHQAFDTSEFDEDEDGAHSMSDASRKRRSVSQIIALLEVGEEHGADATEEEEDTSAAQTESPRSSPSKKKKDEARAKKQAEKGRTPRQEREAEEKKMVRVKHMDYLVSQRLQV
jgi:hypothetical protein